MTLDTKIFKMNNDNNDLKIEAYLGGTMSPEDALEFENLISNDASLREEVKLAKQVNLHLSGEFGSDEISENDYTRDIKTFLRTEEAKMLEKSLLKARGEYQKTTLKPRNRNFLFIAAAIAAMLIVSVGILFLQQDSTENLFAEYYNSTDLPSVIKRGDNHDGLTKGVEAFQNLDYSNAIQTFETYKNSTSEINPAVYLYEGVSYIQLERYEAALFEFDKLIASNSLDSSKGLWFKALVYIKMDNKRLAKNVLEEIIKDPSNFNYSKALELKEEL